MAMRSCKVGLSEFVCQLAIFSTSVSSRLPMVSVESRVLAQTVDENKVEDILFWQGIEAYRLWREGIEQYKISQFEAALKSLQQALKIFREIKFREGEVAALGAIGNVHSSLGEYLKAIDYHQESLDIAREIKLHEGEVNALGNIGVQYLYLGYYTQTIEYLEKSLALAKEIESRQGEGAALGNLGLAYLIIGDYPKTLKNLEQSLDIAREIRNPKTEGSMLGNIGLTYFALKDYSKAIEYQQKLLAIARKIEDRFGEGKALGSIGIAYLMMGDYPKAIENQQQSLAIAREINDRFGEGNALGNLGLAYFALKDYSKTIKYQQQWLALAREIKNPFGESNALNNLGNTYYKEGKLTLAENALMESITVNESLRGGKLKDIEKISFFDTQTKTYRNLQQVLIAQNKTDAALEISERGRGRAFVELLASRLSANSQEEPPNPPNIDQIKQIAKAQNATLVQYSIITDDFRVAGKLEFKESELYIWVIKPTGEIIFRKSDLKPLWQKENTNLTQLIDNTRESMGVIDIITRHGGLKPKKPEGNTQTNQTQNLKQLHKLLIQPIAKYFPNNPNEKVIFIPQSSLFLAPFPALQDKKGKYLIEKHTILTAPSIQVLDLTRQQKVEKQKQKDTSTGQSLIVGNPTMPIASLQPGEEKIKLPPLKGAEKEAITIASLPLLNSKPLIGDAATETAVVAKMFQAKYIHLATHGLFDDIRGLGSAIALAPSNQDDGLLTAEEIFNFQQKFNQKLNAYLVVLSACDTGRGRITGDGGNWLISLVYFCWCTQCHSLFMVCR
jgi:CHAT domain-containing protein/tetratricopeptide (TPR) repeat protein